MVGSRTTPPDWLAAIQRVSEELAALGWVLRSGGASGVDEAAERGWDAANGVKEIFEPWPGWRDWPGRRPVAVTDVEWVAAAQIAEKYHPNWPAIKRAGLLTFRLMSRNSFQVLGPRLDALTCAVLAWTPQGAGGGGTGQALRIARAFNVPVLDLGALKDPTLTPTHVRDFLVSIQRK